jgi:hypothetical protein
VLVSGKETPGTSRKEAQMVQTITIPETEVLVYSYEELDQRAREQALEWFAEGVGEDFSDFHAEHVVDQWAEDMEKFGVEFDTRPVLLLGGSTRYDNKIWWDISYSQSSGAAFEGGIDIAAWLKAHRLTNKYRAIFQAIQDGYQSRCATVTSPGSWVGALNVELDFWGGSEKAGKQANDLEEVLEGWAQEQAGELLKNLREEYEFQCSEEAFVDAIEANDWRFTEDGEIYP